MDIHKKSNILSLASLQERLDSTVFDYVDTTQNWGKAKVNLQDLLGEAVDHFTKYMKENKDLPKSSPFWVLFMGLASRLVYFNALVDENLMDQRNDQEKAEILHAYKVAANCLPNIQFEDNADFLSEIQKSFKGLNKTNAEPQIENGVRSLHDCLIVFYEFTETYKN